MGSFVKFVVLVVALAAGYHFWSHRASAGAAAAVDENGFVPVYGVDGAVPGVVLVLTPANCPSEEAQRAAALDQELTRRGIPHTMGDSFSISADNPSADDRAGIDRAVEVFKQGAPAVFINGMAKSNPTADEVAMELRRSSAKG
jgi:hypothetical protein